MFNVNKFLELMRWFGLPLGIFFAFFWGNNPAEQFNIFAVFAVVFIAGLTGIESLFFEKEASKLSGHGESKIYQRQSGINNIALAITAPIVYMFGWGLYAEAALVTVLIISLSLYSLNHLYTGMKEYNNTSKGFMGSILTLILFVIVVCFLLRVF
jgi:hypothetical protein